MNYANPEGWKDTIVFGATNISGEFFLSIVFCINAIIADHLKVLVRDMYNQTFDKVDNGNTFRDDFMVLMALIVKCHGISVIVINPGSGNDGSAQVSADIFNGDIRGTQIGVGSDIKTIRMVFVNLVFGFS